jgi:hypothetical protein
VWWISSVTKIGGRRPPTIRRFAAGIAVAIIGDDGVRYYGSHLSEIARGIKPGMRVTAGQVLGFTGASGNARGTPPICTSAFPAPLRRMTGRFAAARSGPNPISVHGNAANM